MQLFAYFLSLLAAVAALPRNPIVLSGRNDTVTAQGAPRTPTIFAADVVDERRTVSLNCPMIHSLNYAGQARPVVKTIHDGKLERCYYVLQWDKKTKAFAWTEFSDQESPQFVGEAEAWRKLGRLIKLLKVPMGESFGGKTFMVIDEDTNLIDPTYYFETTKWTQQNVGDCRRHANAFAGLVYDLFLQTAQKGITSTFDQRYLRVNRSFTKAFYIGFNTPKGLKKSQPPSDIANAAKASAASLWNARSVCIVSH
ncbi:hypothetical protein FRB96_008115 [Tulasnella sp. 330]|nr:hypothetical protein FRB96_008115 [Tulasnella sp. 330]